MSLNNNKGFLAEKRASLLFHEKGVPLLISPQLLRALGCGQIDLAKFENKSSILVREVKTNIKNIFCAKMNKQEQRLKQSCELLAKLFNVTVDFNYWVVNEKN